MGYSQIRANRLDDKEAKVKREPYRYKTSFDRTDHYFFTFFIGFMILICAGIVIAIATGFIAAWGALGALWFTLALASLAGFFYCIYRIVGNYNTR